MKNNIIDFQKKKEEFKNKKMLSDKEIETKKEQEKTLNGFMAILKEKIEFD